MATPSERGGGVGHALMLVMILNLISYALLLLLLTLFE